jgi:hypothetical protein
MGDRVGVVETVAEAVLVVFVLIATAREGSDAGLSHCVAFAALAELWEVKVMVFGNRGTEEQSLPL